MKPSAAPRGPELPPLSPKGAVMLESRAQRVLVVTDHVEPTPTLLEALRLRGEQGEVQFRLIVLNPARAEVHLLHPERHDKAAEAEATLHRALPRIQAMTRC